MDYGGTARHSKPTLALAVYSAGLGHEQRRAAIHSLDAVLEPEVVALLTEARQRRA